MLKEYEGRVRLVVKMFPYPYRDYSRIAALAALEAEAQGKFWAMHNTMLKNSPALDRANLVKYAGEAGLDVKRFTDAIDRKQHDGVIERDMKLGTSLEVFGTPTLFFNGRKVVGNRAYDYYKKVLDEELKAARKQ